MPRRSLVVWSLSVAVLGASPIALAQDDDEPERGRIRWAAPRDAEEPERPLDVLPPRSEPEQTEEPDAELAPARGEEAAAGERIDAPADLDRPTAPPAASLDPMPPSIEWADERDLVPHRAVVTASPRTLAGEHLGVWLDVGIGAGGSADESVLAVSGEIGFRYQVADVVVADVSWGLTWGDADVRGEGIVGGAPTAFEASVRRVEPGNPVLSGAWSQSFDDDARVEVGLGVAVPSAARAEPGSDSESLAERRGSLVIHRAALSMRGYWSPWRWAPERFSLFLPARVTAPIDALVLEAEAGVGLMFPVLGDRSAITDVILQASVGAGAQVVGPFHLGARVRVVGAARGLLGPIDQADAPRDDVMVSAEPWARLRFDPVQVSLRGSLNLNGIDGLGGERGPAFGVFAAVGAEL